MNGSDQDSDNDLLARVLDWSARLDRVGDSDQRAETYLDLVDVVRRNSGRKNLASRDLVKRWIRRLADDIETGRLQTPFSPTLELAARDAFRSILNHEHEAVTHLTSTGLADEPAAFVRAFPGETGALRHLGRVAAAFRGSGILGQVDSRDVNQLIAFERGLRNASRQSVAFVPEHMRVTREDLLSWADKAKADGQLPLLIRRLVFETGVGIEEANFPAESGVSSPGFDGVVRASAPSRFVPAGTSVWELSVAKNSYNKAKSDYQKRDDQPLRRANQRNHLHPGDLSTVDQEKQAYRRSASTKAMEAGARLQR